MVLVNVCYLFYQPVDEKIKTWTLRFSAKKTLIWRRHYSTGPSCWSMTSKRSLDWFLESSSGKKFFHPSVTNNQPKPTHVCTRSINQSNRYISVCLFFLFCQSINQSINQSIIYFNTLRQRAKKLVQKILFARFHFKVIRKILTNIVVVISNVDKTNSISPGS